MYYFKMYEISISFFRILREFGQKNVTMNVFFLLIYKYLKEETAIKRSLMSL